MSEGLQCTWRLPISAYLVLTRARGRSGQLWPAALLALSAAGGLIATMGIDHCPVVRGRAARLQVGGGRSRDWSEARAERPEGLEAEVAGEVVEVQEDQLDDEVEVRAREDREDEEGDERSDR